MTFPANQMEADVYNNGVFDDSADRFPDEPDPMAELHQAFWDEHWAPFFADPTDEPIDRLYDPESAQWDREQEFWAQYDAEGYKDHVDMTGCNLTVEDFGDETEPCVDGGWAYEHGYGIPHIFTELDYNPNWEIEDDDWLMDAYDEREN